MPEPLTRKPEALEEHLEEVAECFWLLSQSRPVGFGSASGITTADVLAMATVWGFEPTRFLRVIRALDQVFLKHLHEAAEREKRRKPKT